MVQQKKNAILPWLFCGLFILIFIFSFGVGKYPVSPGEFFTVLWGKLTGQGTWSSRVETVIFRIRMPRIIAGSLVGAGLSAAGAAYQGLFRNPMAAPDILGASAGAGFGAATALFLGFGYAVVSLSAFGFGVLAVFAAYWISRRSRENPTVSMVLSGIMIGSLFSAGTSLIKLLADPHNTLPSITYWLMGSLASVQGKEVFYTSLPILFGLLVLFLLRWPLGVITMGEEEARSMGVSVPFVRTAVILAATLVTAASVSISGMIGWVGLVIPHFSRMLVGNDYRKLYPTSIFMGASFLLLVDNLARSLASAEIPLGVLTAFVGAPFFLYLIMRKENPA